MYREFDATMNVGIKPQFMYLPTPPHAIKYSHPVRLYNNSPSERPQNMLHFDAFIPNRKPHEVPVCFLLPTSLHNPPTFPTHRSPPIPQEIRPDSLTALYFDSDTSTIATRHPYMYM